MAVYWLQGLAFNSEESAVSGVHWLEGVPYYSEVVTTVVTGVTSIASAEAFGVGGIVAGPVSGVTGIASEEVFGVDGYLIDILGTAGIPSEEAFGSGGIVTIAITGTAGIPSEEAFGDGATPPAGVYNVVFGTAGIVSEETFGSGGTLYWSVVGLITGIDSAEAFGQTGMVLTLSAGEFAVFATGVNISSRIRESSISLDQQLNFSANAKFDVYDAAGGSTLSVGQEILLYKKVSSVWTRVFGGTIEETELAKNVCDVQTFHLISCASYARTMSRRLVNKKFSKVEYGSFTSIMTYLSDTVLKAEGIEWVNQGDPDPAVEIEDIEFPYIPLGEVIDRLCELVGWQWQVDWYKRLYAYENPTETTTPFSIAEDTALTYGSPVVIRSRGLYRNRQYIKATFSQTTTNVIKSYVVPLDERIAPDGNAEYQCWWSGQFLRDLRYAGKVARINKIYLNSVEVGWYTQSIPGVQAGTEPPSGWKFCQISQSHMELIWNLLSFPTEYPTAGDTLTVDFDIYTDMPAAIVVEDPVEIAARAAVEGGTGIYEAVEEIADIQDAAILTSLAQGLLDKFKVMGLEVNFPTVVDGVLPGQAVTVTMPSYGIVTPTIMIVESLSAQEEAFRIFRYSVKVSNQVQQRDALAAFQRLVKRLRRPANKNVSIIQFSLAVTLPGITNPGLQVAENVTNAVILRQAITLKDIALYFKTAPVGGDIVIDVKADGVSIFPATLVVAYPDGCASVQVYSSFRDGPLTLVAGQLLTIDVLSAGTSESGKDGTVVITGWS